MDTNNPRFQEFQTRFEELAFLADEVVQPPSIGDCRHYLCLYGENGLTVEEEFHLLTQLESFIGDTLQKVVVETPYWQDTVLFVP